MARSQNGWTVLDEAPPRVELVPGVTVPVLPGDVAWLFQRVARYIHEHVEPLDTPVYEGGRRLPTDDWGWAKRPIRDQETGYSNHASGTAIDLNATQHPRGVKRTWAATEVAMVDRHLAEYEGVVRWGEHYQTTVDGMHFEIIGTPTQVRRVRVKLQTADAEREREAAEAARDQEDDMFLATHSGRYFVVDGAGKRQLTKAAADELVRVGAVRNVGGLSAGTLNEFPTYQEAGTAGGVTVSQLVAADDLDDDEENETPPASGAGG